MARVSGSAASGNTALGNFGNKPLEQILCAFPGTDWDKPLPSIKAFDSLQKTASEAQARWLNEWIAPQSTCGYVLKHHGSEGLSRVIRGIAKACSKHRVPMCERVYSAAIEQKIAAY